MIILSEKRLDNLEKHIDKDFVEFKNKYFDDFLKANNNNAIKASFELEIAYRALKKLKNNKNKK